MEWEWNVGVGDERKLRPFSDMRWAPVTIGKSDFYCKIVPELARSTWSRPKAVSTILAALLVIVVITIAGSVLIYAYSTGLIGNVGINHGTGHEALNMDS